MLVEKKDFSIKDKVCEGSTHHLQVQLLGALHRLPKGTRQWKERDLPDAHVNHCNRTCMTKFSIVIGSPRAYLPRNRRAITWASDSNVL